MSTKGKEWVPPDHGLSFNPHNGYVKLALRSCLLCVWLASLKSRLTSNSTYLRVTLNSFLLSLFSSHELPYLALKSQKDFWNVMCRIIFYNFYFFIPPLPAQDFTVESIIELPRSVWDLRLESDSLSKCFSLRLRLQRYHLGLSEYHLPGN